jgi:hypothetical protein
MQLSAESMSKRWLRETMMTPREKRDMPYIVGLACLAVALMIALAVVWR